MTDTSPTRVSQVLESTLKNLKLEKNFKVYEIWKNWKDLVGDKVAQKTSPDFVKGSTLMIAVENSVWMNELEFQKQGILQKINSQKLVNPPLNDIRFRVMS